METRAHHLRHRQLRRSASRWRLVLFLLWIGKVELNREYQNYDLKFEGSVPASQGGRRALQRHQGRRGHRTSTSMPTIRTTCSCAFRSIA